MVSDGEGTAELGKELEEKQQPEFSLFHSNIIYALSFTGWMGWFTIYSSSAPDMSRQVQNLTIEFIWADPTSSGLCLVFSGDIWLQLERKGNISWVTIPFVALFIVNILLWIDFNFTIKRRARKKERPANRFSARNLSLESYCCTENLISWLLRQLETSLETTVELLSENAVTFVLMTPILWSLQRITWENFFIEPEPDHCLPLLC